MTFVVSSKDEKPEGRSCYRCLHTGADMLSVYPWRPATESWTATGPGSRVDPRGGGTLHTVWSQMKCWMLILLDALILHQSPINTYRKINILLKENRTIEDSATEFHSQSLNKYTNIHSFVITSRKARPFPSRRVKGRF